MRWLVPSLLAVSALASAQLQPQSPPQPLNRIVVGDLPGTNGKWQAGEVTVAAPVNVVQGWFTDVARWPQLFPDDQWARDLGRAPDGRHVAEFHSKIVDRTITVRLREQPGLITYDGVGKNINTQGRIYFQAIGPNQTRIVMQTTGELHGLIGFLAPEATKRDRAIKKITADLQASVKLANAYATTQRRRM